MPTTLRILALSGLLSVSGLASAQSTPGGLDFGDLSHSGAPLQFDQWLGQGFQIRNICGEPFPCLATWGTDSPFQADPAGRTILNNFGGASTTLSRTDGGSFSFQSIALADGFNTGAPVSVTFTFQTTSGASFEQVVQLDHQPGLQTVNFGQTGLKSVSWVASQSAGNWVQFGAVQVTSAVPEPSSLALFLAGLGAVGVLSRRSRMR